MIKQTKQNQSRENVIKKQKEFFKNDLIDNRGYLLDLSDNLFVPFHNNKDEDYKSFLKGKGKELEDKLRAPHSSAGLCVNFFKYWKDNDPIAFYKILWETIFNHKLGLNDALSPVEYEFETEHCFGNEKSRQTGRPGYIDLEIRTTDGLELIHVESKFTEEFNKMTRYGKDNLSDGEINNRNAYRELFKEYFLCDPDDLMNGSETSRYYQLAQRLLFIVENADDHYASYPRGIVLFLYYDYEGFDKNLLEFPKLINDIYQDDFKILSYQKLFEVLKKSFLYSDQHKEWFDYMSNRYFN